MIQLHVLKEEVRDSRPRAHPLAQPCYLNHPNIIYPRYVQVQKNTFMKDIPAFLTQCFGDIAYPEELETFLTYVSQLEFDAQPDYARCKKIFSDGLKRKKLPLDGKVDFSAPKSPVKKVRFE